MKEQSLWQRSELCGPLGDAKSSKGWKKVLLEEGGRKLEGKIRMPVDTACYGYPLCFLSTNMRLVMLNYHEKRYILPA
jgi:hypothetical protein